MPFAPDGALDEVVRYAPDAVICDPVTGGKFSSQLLQDITSALPDARLVVVSSRLMAQEVQEAVLARARAVKSDSTAVLVAAVGLVLLGGSAFSPLIAGDMVSGLAQAQAAPPPRGRGLSGRERQIFELLAQGKADAEIASALRISQRTVQGHITNAKNKLGSQSRIEAIVKFLSLLAQPFVSLSP